MGGEVTRWKKGQSGNPKGRRRKDKAERQDGWVNLLTGLGSTRDKRYNAEFTADQVDDGTAREYWRGNDIAARIIEVPPQEMLRAGWDLRIQTEDDDTVGQTADLAEEVQGATEDLQLDETLERALQYERAYGGSAIFPIINDGNEDLQEPFDLEGLISLSHFLVLEPRELVPVTWYDDITKPKYGDPEVYRLTPVTQGVIAPANVLIHESRLLVFPGVRVSRSQVANGRQGWGDSVLTRVNTVLRDFGVAWESVAAILQDFSQAVYKIIGLANMLASDDKKTFQNRMAAMDLSRSVMRAIVLDTEEDFERKPTPLTGIPETLDKFATRLAAAADMPVTLLMGVSPAGLNATGESDRAFFYDRISRLQRTKLRPRLEQVLKMIFQARMLGPEGKPGIGTSEPPVWSVQWKPLWEPSEKEVIETRKMQADADGVYLDRGVLLPEEVAISRFGGDEYSAKTQIDIETRKKVLELGLKQMHEEAKDPAPTPGEAAQQAADAKAAAMNGQGNGKAETPPA